MQQQLRSYYRLIAIKSVNSYMNLFLLKFRSNLPLIKNIADTYFITEDLTLHHEDQRMYNYLHRLSKEIRDIHDGLAYVSTLWQMLTYTRDSVSEALLQNDMELA
jgi:hypothetical protein